MRSLSYKTLIWNSTWFKHHYAQAQAEGDKTSSDFIGGTDKYKKNHQDVLPPTKPGFFHWLRRPPRV